MLIKLLSGSILKKPKDALTHTGTIRLCILAAFCSIVLTSCEDLIGVDPPKHELVTETVYEDDASAEAAVMGIYGEMIAQSGQFASGSYGSVTFLSGLSGDDFVHYTNVADRAAFNTHSLTPSNTLLTEGIWGKAYNFIHHANAILKGIAASENLSPKMAGQLEGEAKFIRAFCHFYLVNLFGNVPLVKTTDYRINSELPRESADIVYEQIINDLKDAQQLLPEDFEFAGGERVRPNAWAATALLARTYLYTEDWINAEAEATKVINNTSLFNLEPNLDDVFLGSSEEAIWHMSPVTGGLNTNEGFLFILQGGPPQSGFGQVAMNPDLANAFEEGDLRRENWVNANVLGPNTYYYPYKYKVVFDFQNEHDERSVVFRLAELYLIRAEARTRQGNVAGAASDLNTIRQRANLDNTTAATADKMLDAIMQERRFELFTEWGHRWLDLKRTGRADEVLGATKENWESTDILYPIPRRELENNLNLTQNPGYN